MKVYILHRNNFPYDGTPIAVYTCNDDVEPPSGLLADLKQRFGEGDGVKFDLIPYYAAHVNSSADWEQMVCQDVREACDMEPGLEWPEAHAEDE